MNLSKLIFVLILIIFFISVNGNILNNFQINPVILINEGRQTTSNPELQLTLNSPNAQEMQFSCSNKKEWNKTILETNKPKGIFIGDSNNDGNNEIIITNYYERTASVFKWNGQEYEKIQELNTGNKPIHVFVADTTNDGLNEVIIINYDDYVAYVFKWNGNEYEKTHNLNTNLAAYKISVGDSTNDGLNEIIITTLRDKAKVFKWNGSEYTKIYSINTSLWPANISIGDSTDDGNNEVIITNFHSDKTDIYSWNGNSYEKINTLNTVSPWDVFIGDSTNNGENEIITTNFLDNSASVFKWNGIEYVNIQNIQTEELPREVFIADATNNGLNEILVTNSGSDTLSIYSWNGTEYILKNILETENTPWGLFVGDTKNNEKNEIIAVNNESDNVSIYELENEFTEWENYSSKKEFNLANYPEAGCNTDLGEKTIHVKFKYPIGTTRTANASIRLIGTGQNNPIIEGKSLWEISHITTEINKPQGIAIGDITNNGKNELIVGSSHWNNQIDSSITRIYEWNGNSWIYKDEFHSNKANEITIGDVTNDGLNEVIITDVGHKFIQVFKYSNGEWNKIMHELVDRNPKNTTIGDATNDGLNEIITVHSREETITVIKWTGSEWEKHNFRVGPIDSLYCYGLTIGDATNNGLNEILVTNELANSIYLFNWNGVSWVKINEIQTEQSPLQILVADTTENELNEILVTNSGNNSFSEFKWNGTNWNKTNYSTTHSPKEIFFANIDKDEKKEIIILNSGLENSIEIFKNINGNWTSVNQLKETPKETYSKISVGDMKNNGKNEITVTNNNLNRVTIFEWVTTPNTENLLKNNSLQRK
jgi:hypothetical protein